MSWLEQIKVAKEHDIHWGHFADSLAEGIAQDLIERKPTKKSMRDDVLAYFCISQPNYFDEYLEALKKTESPIEQLFFKSLFEHLAIHQLANVYEFAFRLDGSWRSKYPLSEGCVYVYPQLQIEKYRVDFFIETEFSKIVIECDGHDFHERTKAQAARDRSRDRALQALGYVVLRFTGHEIHKDSVSCVLETFKHLETAEEKIV